MKFIILITVCLNALISYGQTDTLKTDSLKASGTLPANEKPKKYKNTFGLEGGGSGLYYSFSYERQVWSNNKYLLTARIGYGGGLNGTIMAVPTEVILGYNKDKSIELGAGCTTYYGELYRFLFRNVEQENTLNIITSLRLGYRWLPEKTDDHSFFRIGVQLLWRSAFWEENRSHVFFYEKRDYYSSDSIWKSIGEGILPWFYIGYGYKF